MTILDAYALVALLAEEPAAADVDALLRGDECAITVFNLGEAIYVTQREHGIQLDELRTPVETLLGDRLALIAPSQEHVWRAAELRLEYYDPRTCSLSFADCFLLAAAESTDRIASPDPAVAHVARAEGIELAPLPDRDGKRP